LHTIRFITVFFDLETRTEVSDLSFWTDRTQGAEGLTRFGQLIEELADHQMTNTNTTLASVE
jgi:hypothetical protein